MRSKLLGMDSEEPKFTVSWVLALVVVLGIVSATIGAFVFAGVSSQRTLADRAEIADAMDRLQRAQVIVGDTRQELLKADDTRRQLEAELAKCRATRVTR